MGVVNVTPDSFSDGGLHSTAAAAVSRAKALSKDGALVVDIGGESTRPGAEPVSVAEELRRVVPVVDELIAAGDIIVSVDTHKPAVAEEVLRRGAHMINDINGLRDPEMVRVCAEAGVPVVVMHMQGNPRTMQHSPHYRQVVHEVSDFLMTTAESAMARSIPSTLIDPGIGFGKTLEHNLALLRALPLTEDHPVLIGPSRKGFIDLVAGVPEPIDRLPGTLAVSVWAALHGTAMVRVHDVAPHVQALRVVRALISEAEY